MSKLAVLKKAKQEIFHVAHPLAAEAKEVRKAYLQGLAVVGLVDKALTPQENSFLELSALALGLENADLLAAQEAAEAMDGEGLAKLLGLLNGEDLSTAFLIEAHLLAFADGDPVNEEKEGLDLLGDMLRMPLTVFRFVQEFSLAVQRKQGKQAQTALEGAYKNGLDPAFLLLRYFWPELAYQEEMGGFVVPAGMVRRIMRPTKLTGPVRVEAGGELVIGAVPIVLDGPGAGLTIQGGSLSMKGTTLEAGGVCEASMLVLRQCLRIKLEGVTFEAGGKARAIYQEGGLLHLFSCRLLDGRGGDGGAIHAALQASVRLKDCQVRRCRAKESGGAIYMLRGAQMLVQHTEFEDCEGPEGGGAIAVQGSTQLTLEYCRFIDCRTAQRGGAIWKDNTEPMEQTFVRHCHFEDCASVQVENAGGALDLYYLGAAPVLDSLNFVNCWPETVRQR
jgi:hypothetical protein